MRDQVAEGAADEPEPRVVLSALRAAIQRSRPSGDAAGIAAVEMGWAANQEIWSTITVACGRLLRILGPWAALDVCVALLEGYLPRFRTLHPRVRNVPRNISRLRDRVARRTATGGPQRWFRDRPTPGTTGFLAGVGQACKALEDVAAAGVCPHTEDAWLKEDVPAEEMQTLWPVGYEWVGHCVHCILSVVLASRDNTAGTLSPTLWRRWNRTGMDPPWPWTEAEIVAARAGREAEEEQLRLLADLLERHLAGTAIPD